MKKLTKLHYPCQVMGPALPSQVSGDESLNNFLLTNNYDYERNLYCLEGVAGIEPTLTILPIKNLRASQQGGKLN